MQDKKSTYETLLKPIRYIAAQFFILKQAEVNPRNAQRELIVLAGLAFVWALSIWANNHEEFSSVETRFYALHCFVVVSAECLIYAAFFLLAKKKVLHRIIPLLIVALFCVTNFYLLVLVHSERIAVRGSVATLLLLIVLFATSLIVLKKFRDMDQSLLPISAAILFLLLATVVNFSWNQHKKHEQLIEIGKFPDHFTFPEFKQRPNVYIIFFDSLIPEAMSRKFLKIDKLKYISAMRQKDLHMLRNVFADRVPTNPSINSFIAMDLSRFDNMPPKMRHLFDTGEVIGPLYEIFRRNNYKIQSIMKSSYFGAQRESNIDFYGISQKLGLCNTEDNVYALLGYCLPALERLRKRLYWTAEQSWPRHLFDRINETSRSPDRWLTLAYMYRPKHTKQSFNIHRPGDLEEYASWFEFEGDPEATSYIYELVELIRKKDRDSVLVILGDHGGWISRGLDKVTPEKRPMSPKEYFQERHAVAAAVYPKDFCFNEFEKLSSIARIGRTIVKCLSGGKDPLPAGYQANDDHLRDYFYE